MTAAVAVAEAETERKRDIAEERTEGGWREGDEGAEGAQGVATRRRSRDERRGGGAEGRGDTKME